MRSQVSGFSFFSFFPISSRSLKRDYDAFSAISFYIAHIEPTGFLKSHRWHMDRKVKMGLDCNSTEATQVERGDSTWVLERFVEADLP